MNAARLMQRLLRLYPRAFRDRFGEDMQRTFARVYADCASPRARAMVIGNALLDSARSASAEWLEVLRTVRHPRLMIADLRHAIRHATRTLLRNPGFALSTILTLAVGIGATTAVFSVMSTALLTPLPYPNADRLVAISQSRKGEEISLSYPDLLDFGARSRAFASIAGFSGQSFTYTGGDEPERIRGQMVTANLFATLGVRPALGRGFVATDDAVSATPVVALSHDLWTRRFGGDSAIVGRSILLSGKAFLVTAVMPRGFRFPDGIVYGPAEAWVPMSQLGNDRDNRDSHPGIAGVGLLRAGMTREQGRADLVGVAAQLEREYAVSNRDIGVIVNDAVDAIVGSLSRALTLVFGAAIAVLLIACANVAGLLLTRAEARRRELTIKVALGADGFRAAANLAGEALILAAVGGVAGVALASGLVRWFGASLADLPRLDALAIDLRAVAFATLATGVVAITCSLAPLWWARSARGTILLNARGTGGSSVSRAREAFVVGQVALSLMLIVTASLLTTTFRGMSASDGGIRPDGVVTFTVQVPTDRYGTDELRSTFARTLTERLGTGRGMRGAALISVLPFSGGGSQSGIGPVNGTREQERRTDVVAITPDYFRTMGIDLVDGRGFTNADNEQGIPVVVVDERFAAAMWPGQRAIGQHVSGWGKRDWTVVGVVRHVKNYGVSADSRQEMYAPYAQRPTSRFSVVIRTSADIGTAIGSARATLKDIDPLLPLFGARRMRDVVDQTVSGPRLAAFLSVGYAVTALLVVVIGMYGALSYLVHRRTREIGVRVALGAPRDNVVRLVVHHALRLTAVGVVIGLAGGAGIGQLIRSQLFGVSPFDIPTFGIAAAAMLCAAIGASAIPAWRALRVSPLVAMGSE